MAPHAWNITGTQLLVVEERVQPWGREDAERRGGHVSWARPLAHGRLVPDPIAREAVSYGGKSWGFGKQEVSFQPEALPFTGHVLRGNH